MNQAFDYFAASVTVVSFERNRSQADFVWYMCGSSNRWQWKDSLTGKSSAQAFASREDAMTDANAAIGRC